MARKVKTRTLYKLVGSDYSAQEPRITTFLSGDEAMRQAYLEGKDLYCVIAANIYNNDYWDNTEFYKEFTEVDIGGNKVIAGSDKTLLINTDAENSITVPWCYLLETEQGDVAACDLATTDCIKAGEEWLEIESIQYVATTIINDVNVKIIKITFKIDSENKS